MSELITDLPSKKWIGVFAHPDDEWIAGWPVFQNPAVQKGVVFFAGRNGPFVRRNQGWRSRVERVLRQLDIALLGCLDLSPDFYAAGRDEVRMFPDALGTILKENAHGDFALAPILTHNPMGEYGHPDHQAVFGAVISASPAHPVFVTDLCYQGRLSPLQRATYYRNCVAGPFSLDTEMWNSARRCYETEYVWTGKSVPPGEQAKLYRIGA